MEMVAQVRPLLFVGSRRSGTTLMNHIINTHPQLYSSFERYSLWLLYQKTIGQKPGPFPEFPNMHEPYKRTLAWSGHILRNTKTDDKSIRKAFFDMAYSNMRARTDGKTKNPVWIGEKNPEIASEPMWSFVYRIFPDARFIHMIRHPIGVVRSKQGFVEKHKLPKIWAQPMAPQLEFWVKREEFVLDLVERGVQIITVKLEDVWEDPEREFNRVFDFFDVESGQEWHKHIDWLRSRGASYDLEVRWDIPGLQELMERYGYD